MKKIAAILLAAATGFLLHAGEIRIFRGNSTYSSDCVATYKNGKLYRGNSTYSSDCIATYYDGKFYKGNSTYSSDCFVTYYNRKLYRGNSTYSSDCVFTFSGNVKNSPALPAWTAYRYFNILFM